MDRFIIIAQRWPRSLSFLFAQLAIWSIWSGGSDPDSVYPYINNISVLGALAGILVACESIGALVDSRIPSLWDSFHSLALRVLWGLCALLVLTTGLGLLGLIGANFVLLYLLLLFVACVFADWTLAGKRPEFFTIAEWTKRLCNYWPALLVLAIAFFFVWIPANNPDPLYYHLRAPKFWFQSGGIIFDPRNPLFFLTGIWESIYLLSMHILPIREGFGLIEQQLLAQSLHFIFGALLSVPILQRLGENTLQLDKASSQLIVLMLFCSSTLFNIVPLAKNDWGGILYSGACLLFFNQYRRDRTQLWAILAGLMLGFVFTTKLTHVLTVLLASAAIILQQNWRWKELIRSVGYFAIGFVVGASAIVVRNLLFVGSPLFPMGANSHISLSDQYLFASLFVHPGAFSWSKYAGFSLELLRLAPIAVFVPLLLVFRERLVLLWTFALLGVFSYFLLFVHPSANWRLNGIYIFLLMALAAMSLKRLYGLMSPSESIAKKLYLGSLVCFCLLTAISSGLPKYIYGSFLNFTNPSQLLRYHTTGEAMAWLRLNGIKEKKVFFGGNLALYYVQGYNVTTIESDLEVAAAIQDLKTGEERVRKMNELGAEYFIETDDVAPWGVTTAMITKIINRCKECIVYSGHGSRVVSVPSLVEFISAEEYTPEPAKPIRTFLPKQN